MNAIINSRQPTPEERTPKSKRKMCTCNNNIPDRKGYKISFCLRTLTVALTTLILWPGYFGSPLPVFGQGTEVKAQFLVESDADGNHLRFPRYLFYDEEFDETYLSAGGGGNEIVYDSTFFPLVMFSSGRGIDRPFGGFMDHRGMIYICQGANKDKGKPERISIFNRAFLPVREIIPENIPGEPDFYPRQLVVSREGLLYVVGAKSIGIVVLDNEGTFLRWLRPMDEISFDLEERAAAVEMAEKESVETAESDESVSSSTDKPPEEKIYADIPEEFRPKTKEERKQSEQHIGPVYIQSVSIDRSGNLYLLSVEAGKVYVYNREESFLFSFGRKGGTPRTLSQPRKVAIDENRGLVYVVDFMRHCILTYDKNNGEFLFEFGGKGGGPGWFAFPTDIVVNRRGQLVVADLFNHRLQVLDVIPPSSEIPESEYN